MGEHAKPKPRKTTPWENFLNARILVDSMNDGLGVIDSEKIFVYVNSRFGQILGYSVGEMVGRKLTSFLNTENKIIVEENIHRRRMGEPSQYELEWTSKDGSLVPTIVSGTPILDKDGRHAGSFAIVTDISQRKKAERALEDNERFLSGVFASIQDGISILDTDMAIVRVNHTMEKWYSHAMPLVGQKCYVAYHSRDLPCDVCPTIKTLNTGQPAHELVPLTGAGRVVNGWLDLFSFPMFDSQTGRMTGVIEYVRDVTSQKAAEESLRENEARMRGILSSLHETMVVVFDRAGSVVSSWSPTQLDERYGINTKDQLTLDAMLSPVEVEIKKRQIEHVFTTGLAIRDRYNTQMPGGGFWHDVTLSPMWDAAGRVSAVVGFIRDITDLMRAEWQLRNVRDRSLLYLDIMGHDLRNQLQVILASTTLLQERTSDPVATELLEQAVAAAEKCAKIISKVKATEDIFSTPIQTRSLTLALRRCIEALRSIYPEVQVEESYLAEDAAVPADDFLEHLLWNVVENAFEHNPKDRKTLWVTLREQDEGYEVSIADNGHGIPDKVKSSLFDMSRRYGGVGLHQSKQIVEKYGGLIHVIDRVPGEPGQGAEFRIWLPRAHGTAFDWRE